MGLIYRINGAMARKIVRESFIKSDMDYFRDIIVRCLPNEVKNPEGFVNSLDNSELIRQVKTIRDEAKRIDRQSRYAFLRESNSYWARGD